jgi:hypothetical protein
MEEYIEACADVHCCGACFCVVCVNDPESGLQRATSNAGLKGLGGDVKDSSAGRFGASPGSSWNLRAYSQLYIRSAYVTRTRNQRA